MWARTTSLLTATLLAVASLALCALDIFFRIYLDSKVLAAVSIAAALLGGGSLLILSTRRLLNFSNLRDIPKFYIPLNKSDLPGIAHTFIHNNLKANREIRASIKPPTTYQQGCGYISIGKSMEVINFGSSLTKTFQILVDEFQSSNLFHESPCTLRDYVIELINLDFINKNEGFAFIEAYEKVLYADYELSEIEFFDLMQTFSGLRERIRLNEHINTE